MDKYNYSVEEIHEALRHLGYERNFPNIRQVIKELKLHDPEGRPITERLPRSHIGRFVFHSGVILITDTVIDVLERQRKVIN